MAHNYNCIRSPLITSKMDRDSLYILEEEEEEEEAGQVGLVGYPGLTVCSPLHLLARSGDAAAIRSFLQACDPQMLAEHLESRTVEDSTPLQVAAYFGQQEAVRALQEFGASRTHRNKYGWHAGHYAARWSQPLDMRLAIGLRPVEAGRNSRSFAYRNIRDLRRKAEVAAAAAAGTTKRGGGGRLKTADSGICVCDSKEILNLE